MSERLPYEDSIHDQLNDLPLPDENRSWEEMRKLLEEDDDDRVPPPIFLRGCLGWGLLLLLVLGGLWFWLRPEKWGHKNETPATQTATAPKPAAPSPPAAPSASLPPSPAVPEEGAPAKSGDRPPSPADTGSAVPSSKKHTSTATKDEDLVDTHIIDDRKVPAHPATHSKTKTSSTTNTTRINTGKGKLSSQTSQTGKQPARRNTVKNSGRTPVTQGQKPKTSTKPPVAAKPSGTKDEPQPPAVTGNRKTDSLSTATISIPPSPVTTKTDTLKKIDTVKKAANPPPADSSKRATERLQKKKKGSYYVSAGIGLQQQIPIAGQTSTPYNYYGRKGSLADYIPSVYVRLHRDEKWYVQGEFRYGAPQSVKEFPYSQKTVSDSSLFSTTTTTLRLKKTFYHQLPVSFNYYVLPHWSLGTGILYSRFHGAVTEQDIEQRTAQRDTVFKKVIHIPSSTDSFFTRSQVQILFQTEFTWRRLSLSVRYTRGLQPYIRYRDAAGTVQEQTNQSFDAALRFRIWRSKKKAG